MSSFLYLALGVLTAICIIFFGAVWSPDRVGSSLSFQTGLAAYFFEYYGALLVWALTPIWLSLSLGRKESRNLERSRFLRANLSLILFLNMSVIGTAFWYLVWAPSIAGFLPDQFQRSFEYFVVLALLQHIGILVIWLAGAQADSISNEFISAGAVGIGRKESLSECVENAASILLAKSNNDPLVKKQIDNLLEDIRMLPRFTNQAGFSKAFKLINGWSETQLKNFSSFAPNLSDSQATLDAFANETKSVCKRISKIQN